MDTAYLTCPLCGFAFDRRDTLCSHGCPLGMMCTSVRCPSCDYEFPERPERTSWMAALLGRRRVDGPRLPENVVTLQDLRVGERGNVLCLGSGSTSRPNVLATFGLVPGTEVTLIQRQPSCVVRVGQTELALDLEIARDILLRRVLPESGS